MKRTRNSPIPASGVLQALRSSPAYAAPASLLPAVLKRVGLADLYWKLDSPVGTVFVAASGAGISMVSRAKSEENFERSYERFQGRPVTLASANPPAAVRALLKNLKSRDREKLRFDLRKLSEFERAVLMKALEIPGGAALSKNPVPLLIPCHRVVRADGTVGNYSLGGSRVKRTLLEVEDVEPDTIERLASKGIRYLGNEKERFYCYPTCGGTRALVTSNRVPFHNEHEALAAGYRPCEACRPAA